jgi:excisionase family DNA binding protein
MEPKREELLAELFGGNGVPPMLAGRLLRTREVAQLFQVSERTVAEWARRGRIPSVRTPGGHRLYPADQVRRLLVATEHVGESGGGTGGVVDGAAAD